MKPKTLTIQSFQGNQNLENFQLKIKKTLDRKILMVGCFSQKRTRRKEKNNEFGLKIVTKIPYYLHL